MRLLGWTLFVYTPLIGLGAAAARTYRRRWEGFLAAPALGLIGLGLYLYGVEPTWLEVTRSTIPIAGLNAPIRLVVLADFQTDRIGAYEQRVIDTVAALEADLLILPGDYIQSPKEVYDGLVAAMNETLRERLGSVPLGGLAVEGDMERPGWKDLFRDTPIVPLESGDSVPVAPGVVVTGLASATSHDARATVPRPPGADVHIVVGHAPDFALGRVDAELLLAGHTHGGQVQIPFFGPLYTFSSVPRAWGGGGLQTLQGGRALYVSRGTGMERSDAPRLRFNCRPELAVLELVPAG